MNQTGNVRDGLGFEVILLLHLFGVELVSDSLVITNMA